MRSGNETYILFISRFTPFSNAVCHGASTSTNEPNRRFFELQASPKQASWPYVVVTERCSGEINSKIQGTPSEWQGRPQLLAAGSWAVRYVTGFDSPRLNDLSLLQHLAVRTVFELADGGTTLIVSSVIVWEEVEEHRQHKHVSGLSRVTSTMRHWIPLYSFSFHCIVWQSKLQRTESFSKTFLVAY